MLEQRLNNGSWSLQRRPACQHYEHEVHIVVLPMPDTEVRFMARFQALLFARQHELAAQAAGDNCPLLPPLASCPFQLGWASANRACAQGLRHECHPGMRTATKISAHVLRKCQTHASPCFIRGCCRP